MKTFQIKLNKRKGTKDIDKNKKLEIEYVKIRYADKTNKLENASKALNKIFVNILYLRQIRDQLSKAYRDEFEKVGTFVFGEQVRQTHISFGIFMRTILTLLINVMILKMQFSMLSFNKR